MGTQLGRPVESGTDQTVPAHGKARDGQLAYGKQIGRYLVVGTLGRGGMGVVYAVYDPVLDRKIAVKVLSYVDDGEGRARMQREAQALGRLTHPNVITVYDVAEHEGATFIAMEIVEGGTLREWRGTRPWREVIAGYISAARGLAAAHKAGLVHRDFKPENVLVGEDDRIRVTDFGLARAVGEKAKAIEPGLSPTSPLSDPLTVDGAVMGTPSYMAPEQIDGGTVDARSDQFAWCVALWEALYNEQPFPTTGNLALRSAAIQAEPPKLPAKSAIPVAVGRALVRGMAGEPKDRWPDLDALIAELDRATRIRRTGLVAGTFALGAATLIAMFAIGRRSSAPPDTTCDAAGAAASTLWTATQKASVAAAFDATKAPFAADAIAALDTKLVAWRGRWQHTAIESCKATQTGSQSAVMLDLRGGCLARRRAELDNVMVALATANRGVVEAAPGLSLPDLDTCDDAAQLAGVTPRPRDARLAPLETKLDGIERELVLGLPLDLARALVTPARLVAIEADMIGWKPLVARADKDVASIERELGDKHARTSLIASAAASSAANDLDTLADTYIQLLDVEARLTSDFELGDGWGQLAEGTLARLGPRPDKQVLLARARGIAAERAGHYRTAERIYTHELELAREPIDKARALDDLAIVESNRDELVEARAHLEQAIPIARSSFGSAHPRLASLEHGLGLVAWREGHFAESVEHYKRALAVREQSFGPDSIEYATSLEALGVSEMSMGKLDIATEHVEKAVAVFEARLGPDNPDVASAYNDAGGAYHRAGLYQRAFDTAKKTLAAREKALGPDHPDVAQSLVNMAIESKAMGKILDGNYERALAIFDKSLGADNTTTGITHLNYAEALRVEGKLDKSAEEYAHAKANFEKTFGPDHPVMAHIFNGLGQLELAKGNPEAATPLLQKAVKIRETDGEPTELAESRFALARATHDKKLAEQARDAYIAAGPNFAKEADAVTAWLAKP